MGGRETPSGNLLTSGLLFVGGETHDVSSFLLFPPGLVDRSTVEKSIMDNESFKDQMSVKKFSIDGKSEMESHVLADYSDMMQKLYVVEKSQCFRRLWKMRAEQTKATIPDDQVFSVEDVQEKIYQPAIADFQKTYRSLKDFSITLGAVQSQFEKLLGDKDQLLEEFKIMEDSEGPKGGRARWIAGAVERIENYLTLSKVVNPAKMIDALRQMLRLEGDFQILSDLTKYVRRSGVGICVGCSWENPRRQVHAVAYNEILSGVIPPSSVKFERWAEGITSGCLFLFIAEARRDEVKSRLGFEAKI